MAREICTFPLAVHFWVFVLELRTPLFISTVSWFACIVLSVLFRRHDLQYTDRIWLLAEGTLSTEASEFYKRKAWGSIPNVY